jgi:hypothetical protein
MGVVDWNWPVLPHSASGCLRTRHRHRPAPDIRHAPGTRHPTTAAVAAAASGEQRRGEAERQPERRAQSAERAEQRGAGLTAHMHTCMVAYTWQHMHMAYVHGI